MNLTDKFEYQENVETIEYKGIVLPQPSYTCQ